MPTPRIWASLAARLRPFRRAAIGVLLVCWTLVAASMVVLSKSEVRLTRSWWFGLCALSSASFLSGGVLCVISWFDPAAGTLWREPGKAWLRIGQAALRWWAAIVLLLLFLFGLTLLFVAPLLGRGRAI